jgi:hypothetical protein
MKILLIRDKSFLKSLYEGSNPLKNKRLLNSSNDRQLDTILKYLHFVSNGHIKIKKENFEIINSENRLKLIKSTGNNILSNFRTTKIYQNLSLTCAKY